MLGPWKLDDLKNLHKPEKTKLPRSTDRLIDRWNRNTNQSNKINTKKWKIIRTYTLHNCFKASFFLGICFPCGKTQLNVKFI